MIKRLKPEFLSGLQLLEEVYPYLENPETVNAGMDLLHEGLHLRRKEWDKETWLNFRQEICLTHPIRALLHQDPVTYRSFSKPRGYAGDACLLDFLYRNLAAYDELCRATRIGQAICNHLVSRPSSESVRWRRELLAKWIDEVAEKAVNPEILSVACGHLREANHSVAIKNNRIKRFVAFDQDEESLRTLEAEKNGANIECFRGSIKDLIRRKIKIGKFDFIYSAGLYDYLPDSAARLLTKSLFDMLKPGGRLLIANFTANNAECGYMEAFMDWDLIYRSREEFVQAIGPLQQNIHQTFFDENRCVVYLELWKNSSKN